MPNFLKTKSNRRVLPYPKEYPLVIEEMTIDENGYYLMTCQGTKFRIIKCKGECKGGE
jgi:hypothetical protein